MERILNDDAQDLEALREDLQPTTVDAVHALMARRRRDRPAGATAARALLEDARRALTDGRPARPAAPRRRRRRARPARRGVSGVAIAGAVLFALALMGAGFGLARALRAPGPPANPAAAPLQAEEAPIVTVAGGTR